MGTIVAFIIAFTTLTYSPAAVSTCDCQTEQNIINDDYTGSIINDDYTGS